MARLSFLVAQTEPKKKLTPEEAAQAAEELRRKIKAKNQVCSNHCYCTQVCNV